MPAIPVGGVMVVGQDFDTYASFSKSLAAGGEVLFHEEERPTSSSATWRTLIDLLPRRFGIPLGRCFFTNAYMGLRKDGPPTGPFIGSKCPDFTARCRAFFRKQLASQRPRLILSLGVWVPSFIAPLSATLSDWTGLNSFAEIDDVGPVRHGVAFTGTPVDAASVVCLTHPSLRGPNVRRRRYRGLAGDDAERRMVEDAIGESAVDLRTANAR